MSNTQSLEALAPLSVEVDLDCTINGVEARVESTGERVLVGFDSLLAGVRAMRGQPTDPALTALLTTADLTVEVRVRDRIVAVAGADAQPGALSEALAVDPIELRLGGSAGALVAEITSGVERLRQVFR